MRSQSCHMSRRPLRAEGCRLEMSGRRPHLLTALHMNMTGRWANAFAQPLPDVPGLAPEFFVARNCTVTLRSSSAAVGREPWVAYQPRRALAAISVQSSDCSTMLKALTSLTTRVASAWTDRVGDSRSPRGTSPARRVSAL